LVQNDFSPVPNDFLSVQNDFSPVPNDFSSVQNDFSPVPNDFSPVQNDFGLPLNDFCLGRSDFCLGRNGSRVVSKNVWLQQNIYPTVPSDSRQETFCRGDAFGLLTLVEQPNLCPNASPLRPRC
jgi:hypothetical protein